MKALVLSLLAATALATLGVDFYSLTDTSVYSCMAGSGIGRVIVRGYQSFGQVDPSLAGNLANAQAGGVGIIDVYLFPCVPCGNAAGQASDLWNALGDSFSGIVWLDIETYQWGSDLGANQAFISELASTLSNSGANVGVYTNYYNWQAIVGLGWTGVAQYPLWYAHYDNNLDFGDFTAFGGWNSPTMKQYNGGATVCGAWVDSDFF